MDNSVGSTNTFETVVCSSLTFLRIHIPVILAWFPDAANTLIRRASGNRWMEEILNVSSWGKAIKCVGSYIASIQEKLWQVSFQISWKKQIVPGVSKPLVSKEFFFRLLSDPDRILRGGIVDSFTGFGLERTG